MATKVFIVDDHFMVIEGIRSLLQNEKGIEWCGHATNAPSCLAALQAHQPDVIFMDINLPGVSGIDLCKQVKEKYASIFIIGLSTFNQQSFIRKMMDNGASGYLLKNATQDELMEGIHAVMKGKLYLSDEVASTLRRDDSADLPVITRREKEVLELIAEGLTNVEIASRLFVAGTTVDTHRKNLLFKLNARNTAELIKIAVVKKLISFC